MRKTLVLKWTKLSIVVFFLVIVSVSGFVWIHNSTHTAPASAPLRWVSYVDPHGFYSVDLPFTWSVRHFVQGQVVKGVNGDITGENVFFEDGTNTGMVIFVAINAPATTQCPVSSANATVAGIPAIYRPIIHNGRDFYGFATVKADFQISYRASLVGKSETATETEQTIYTRFISTFKPDPATSIHC